MNALAFIRSWWGHRIQWKLVSVFVCVTVIPMLVVAEAATDVVAKTFQTNVQAWLFQASRFFIADIVDERREVESAAALVGLGWWAEWRRCRASCRRVLAIT